MAEFSVDSFADLYARRTAGLSASEVRALFAVASRPEVVSLAGGMPYVSALPTELVTAAVERTISERATALQYGSGQGMPALREQILDVMALEGIRASAQHPCHRGQPLWTPVLRRPAAAGHALGGGGRRRVPRNVLEDLRPRAPCRVGSRSARYSRETRLSE